jgi:hypothetical protein
MFTTAEKKTLIDLLNAVQITGTRASIGKTLEQIDALIRKIEALPTEDPKPELPTPA